MNHPRSAPAWMIRPPGAFLAAAASFLLALAAPGGASGQAQEQLVYQRRLDYQTAKLAYETAIQAQKALERQFGSALEAVKDARRSGNNDALERAYALAQDRGISFGAQEERVATLRDSVTVARQQLIDVITERLEQLLSDMDAASSAQQRAELNDIWRDLDNELKSLEAESAEGFRIQPIVMPEIRFDPREGRAEVLQKASLLERRAAVADTTIQDIDRRIKSLTDRLRIRRQRSDMLANLDRFDDTRVPVVAGQPTGDRGVAADSTAAGAVPLTLEERLRLLREGRQHLVNYRDQLLVRARSFRETVRSISQ